MQQDQSLTSSKALKFVLILGIVNLFADMTYEGARSVNGAYLQMLGASAAAVGFTAGLGELIGYGFRSVTGFISERTGRAIRKPSTEAMLSFASKQVGTGKTFGLVESLDQIGATVGPLIIALTFFLGHSYRAGY